MKNSFFFLILFSLTLQASLLTIQKEVVNPVEGSISYCEDVNGDLNFEQLESEKFTLYTQERSVNFGFTKSVYWFKIDLHNLSFLEDTH